MVMTEQEPGRRPIKTRSARWAQRMASFMAGLGISPNAISILSIVFALLGAAALLWYPGLWGFLACALCIQLRLLCNMLDGMVAVEHGRQTPLGLLYNELPDRIADVLFIAALGYAAGTPWLGWLGAVLAVATAYVRALGGALGFPQDFAGLVAKPQRMAIMTLGCVIASIEVVLGPTRYALTTAAVLIAAGSAWTCARRTLRIAALLRAGHR